MRNKIIDILTNLSDNPGHDIRLPRREAELIADKLLNAFGTVAFICDGKACKKCSSYCHHTLDINHAKNFGVWLPGKYFEIPERPFSKEDPR